MSEFLYLYRGGERPASAEGMQKQMQKWTAWMKELSDKGHLKNPGQPLEATGKVVKGKPETVTDGPYAEAKDIVGGYTLIEATDLAQAAKLSSGCPILAVGGLVEVRPIMRMDM
ncbi:MAG: YciI family protein [Myxococcaceae bacterium]